MPMTMEPSSGLEYDQVVVLRDSKNSLLKNRPLGCLFAAMAGVEKWRGMQVPLISWTEWQAGQILIMMVWLESAVVSIGGESSSNVAGQPQPLYRGACTS